jgi:hypothetical protein
MTLHLRGTLKIFDLETSTSQLGYRVVTVMDLRGVIERVSTVSKWGDDAKTKACDSNGIR